MTSTPDRELRAKIIKAMCFKAGITGYLEQFERIEALFAQEQAKLQQEVMDCLPEKIKLDNAVYMNKGDGYAQERVGKKLGFNEALETMKTNLKVLFDKENK